MDKRVKRLKLLERNWLVKSHTCLTTDGPKFRDPDDALKQVTTLTNIVMIFVGR